MDDITKEYRELLVSVIEKIDKGGYTYREAIRDVTTGFFDVADSMEKICKYRACQILCISRATFDNYVREGKLPRGKHIAGYKELSWTMKQLNEFKAKYWRKP